MQSADPPAPYDRKLASILRCAARVFAEKGYHEATIRDVAASAEVSLSGLYYYVKSKEHLLFLIQDHCFRDLLERQHREALEERRAEDRLRRLVRTHLRYFAGNMDAMKVLSHESDVLTGLYREAIIAQKREYTDLVRSVLAQLRPRHSIVDLRSATFFLFGMMNWLYTWYRPDRDGDVDHLADEMTHVFLSGLAGPELEGTPEAGSADAERSPGTVAT